MDRLNPSDVVESVHKGKRGLRRLVNAFNYSMSGLRLAYRHEEAFRQEILGAVILLPIACLIPVTPVERVLLIGTVLLVLIVELLNSSVEAAVDRAGLDTHHLAKRAKDIGSAAVFLALILLGTTWFLIAGPMLLALVQNSR
jgi:diacylglycerol kinase (ATP)